MIRADAKDKKLVISILTSAFIPKNENNSINLVVKQDKNRIQRMHILMGYLFDRAMLFGEVFISDNKKACLILNFPHKEKVTCKTMQLDLKLVLQCIVIERVFKVINKEEAFGFPIYYLRLN